MVDTNDQWITERTGIKTRYICEEGQETSDMATLAGQEAIDKAGLKNEDIDCIMVATCSPDQLNPSVACITSDKLGLVGIPSFDLNAMCSGFIYGLQIAQSWAETNLYKNILLIGPKSSQILSIGLTVPLVSSLVMAVEESY